MINQFFSLVTMSGKRKKKLSQRVHSRISETTNLLFHVRWTWRGGVLQSGVDHCLIPKGSPMRHRRYQATPRINYEAVTYYEKKNILHVIVVM